MQNVPKWVIAGVVIIILLLEGSPSFACENYSDGGIALICQKDEKVIAGTSRSDYYKKTFGSTNGGLNWIPSASIKFAQCVPTPDILVDPTNPQIQYSWQTDDRIERSTDGGQTWTREFDLSETRKDIHEYYFGLRQGRFCGRTVEINPVPSDAIIDATTGNVIYAMGWYGVLVRTPDGEYHWANVGNDYGIHHPLDLRAIYIGILLMLVLALILIPTINFYSTYTSAKARHWTFPTLVISWIVWLYFELNFVFKAYINPDLKYHKNVFDFAFALLTLLIGIEAFLTIKSNFSQGIKKLMVAVMASIMFISPFILWMNGIVYRYRTAYFIALLLTMLWLAVCFVYTRVTTKIEAGL